MRSNALSLVHMKLFDIWQAVIKIMSSFLPFDFLNQTFDFIHFYFYSSDIHIRMKLRDALTQMLGEFVASQKSPDFRLTTASNQQLNEAVKEERRNSIGFSRVRTYYFELIFDDGSFLGSCSTTTT